MPVNPTKFELIKAYRTHKKLASRANTMSHKLLWSYATECALKAYYLHINNLANATQGNIANAFGHSINKLVRDCNIPNFTLQEPNDNHGINPIKDFHEAMRYGTSLPNNIEISQLEYLITIAEELENHL